MALLRFRPLTAVVVALLTAAATPAVAQTLTQDEALRLAFPRGTSVERRTAYLDDEQLAQAEQLAGPDVEVTSGIITHYVGTRDGTPAGVAYFDAHRVRTLPEVLMIVVDNDARVRRVEVLTFHEPPEYRAPGGWLRQFEDRSLDRALSLRGGIVNMTGATLTSNAVTRAVRRVLALHQVIDPVRTETP